MKKILVFVCALSIVLCSLCVAFAEDDSYYTGNADAYSVGDTITPDMVAGGDAAASSPIILMSSPSSASESDTVTVRNLDDAAAPASGSLSDLATRVFGAYTPRTQTVTVYLSDGSTVDSVEPVPGVAGMDWYWISGVAVFLVVLISMFRLLGVVFKRG